MIDYWLLIFVTSIYYPKPGRGVTQPEVFNALVGSQPLKKTQKWYKRLPWLAEQSSLPYPNLISSQIFFLHLPPPRF